MEVPARAEKSARVVLLSVLEVKGLRRSIFDILQL